MSDTLPPHLTQHWHLTKPSASGTRGMVVSQSRDAALAGVAILDAGGNAVDAAVGTALALATVEPWNSGLGGIGFALVHRAGSRTGTQISRAPAQDSRQAGAASSKSAKSKPGETTHVTNAGSGPSSWADCHVPAGTSTCG